MNMETVTVGRRFLANFTLDGQPVVGQIVQIRMGAVLWRRVIDSGQPTERLAGGAKMFLLTEELAQVQKWLCSQCGGAGDLRAYHGQDDYVTCHQCKGSGEAGKPSTVPRTSPSAEQALVCTCEHKEHATALRINPACPIHGPNGIAPIVAIDAVAK